MHKKLTLTIDQEVYEGLHKVLGPRHISQFIESLVRPHVISSDLFSVYQKMAEDERREKKALEWSEGLMGDIQDDPR